MNKNSAKTLNKALVKYIKEYKKTAKPLESFYFRDKDESLTILTDLGTEYVPEMPNEISLGNPWSNILMVAIEEITKVEKTQEINASTKENRDKWITNFETKLNSYKTKTN